jgi:hypothetical protein
MYKNISTRFLQKLLEGGETRTYIIFVQSNVTSKKIHQDASLSKCGISKNKENMRVFIKRSDIINDLNEIKLYFTFAATVQLQTNAACCRHR